MRVIPQVIGIALVCVGVSVTYAQNVIKVGDTLALRKESVFIYEAPGGEDNGEITTQDLRSNGDRIIVKEVKEYRGQTWYRVAIVASPRPAGSYRVPDADGWLRGRDVVKGASKSPYGGAKTWQQILGDTIGVQAVSDLGDNVEIHMKANFLGSLGSANADRIVRRHIDFVWQNVPRVKRVRVTEGATVLAESIARGDVRVRN